MLCELSSKTRNLDLPVQHEPALFILPAPHQIRERGAVDYFADGLIHLLPHLAEVCFAFAAGASFGLLRPLDETQHLAHGERIGRACEQVSAFGAAARFDEPGLFKPDRKSTRLNSS